MVVGRDQANVRAPDPEDGCRALNSVVRLRRGVDGDFSPVEPVGRGVDSCALERPLPRSAERDEIRDRAAARVDALHLGREPAELGQPVERKLLEQVEGRQRVPLRRRERRCGARSDRNRRRSDRDPAPEPGIGEPHAVRDHDALELVDDAVGADPLVGQGARQRIRPLLPPLERVAVTPVGEPVELGADVREARGEVVRLRRVHDVHSRPRVARCVVRPPALREAGAYG